MKLKIYLFYIPIALSSCKLFEPSYQRCEQLYGTSIVIDTVHFISPAVVIDCTTVIHDTIVFEKDRLTVRIERIKGDTFNIKGECKADTIVKTIIKETHFHNYTKKFRWRWYHLLVLWIIIAIATLYIIHTIIKTLFK